MAILMDFLLFNFLVVKRELPKSNHGYKYFLESDTLKMKDIPRFCCWKKIPNDGFKICII